ncbi:unnamed protein product [Notodromas monacha]|uniref:Stress-induced-phosphoprotein 1 n=1 Tax=Notodromas monacha TaxID=399045 RepID=A0A7R9BQM4_9CRUS|nr:unnamed protein product [Notodromas monacha]CAG0918529.1 unnamed protein product [Notodromas monacha]
MSTAQQEKELGNAAYKAKNFDEALVHYQKAIDIDPTDITFYNNMGAVYFEKKSYDEVLKWCEKAVEVGRENRADYKLIAKALLRLANAHKELGDLYKAKSFFEKSLSEHRTPVTKEALSHVEKLIKEQERVAYIDPKLAEEAKAKGNEFFSVGNFSEAVKHYSEAIKRNPDDAKLYSNRAAAYTKLMAFDYALKDCDDCLRLDPSFVKGYLRKGKVLIGMKQFSRAADAYQKALELDHQCQEAIDGYRQSLITSSSDPEETCKQAMADPEVQQILQDPAMRMILRQIQEDPAALGDHLKNPDVASKFQKLIESGVLSFK